MIFKFFPSFLLAILLSFSNALAQDTTHQKSSRITSDVFIGYGSTNVDNEMVSKFLVGGYIDSTIKNRASSKLSAQNRFGAEINYEIRYYNLKDTFINSLPNVRCYFGFGSYTNISGQYSRDIFNVMFYGNKDFEGKTAHLSPTKFFLSDIKKLSFGILNTKNQSKFGLSVICGNSHKLYDLKTASLTTAQGGGQLELIMKDGLVQESDSIPNGYLSFSGIGAALDIEFRLFKEVSLSITNFGIAVWNRNPSQIKLNDTIQYNGFEINNIFNAQSFDFEQELDSLLPERESKSFTSMLPSIIELKSIVDEEKMVQPYYGIRYKILSNYFPYFYLGGYYAPTHYFKASAAISYGGYTGFEGNLNLYYTSTNLAIGLGTNNLIGSFSKKGLGRSIGFSASFLF